MLSPCLSLDFNLFFLLKFIFLILNLFILIYLKCFHILILNNKHFKK